MEARYLKEQLEGMLGGVEIFLDFDNLSDLRVLLQHVRESDVFVILLTAEVLLRPWCILEIHTAVSAGIPISFLKNSSFGSRTQVLEAS